MPTSPGSPFAPSQFAMLLLAGLAAAPAPAQTRFVFIDRTPGNNRIWAVDDRSGNGSIEEGAELSEYWSAANAAGTGALVTPQGIALHPSGLIAVGDNGAGVRGVVHLRDWNRNNDAMAPGESWLAASSPNPSGIVLNTQGVAFDAAGTLYASSAFNSSAGSNAAIYRLNDTDGDRRYMTAGEITEYVFMASSSSYVPFDIAIDASVTPSVGYVKSSATNIGVFRFTDADGNGRADDAGEFMPFATPANASAVTVAAGALTLTLDPLRPRAVYFTQISSAVRQLLRAVDLNSNGTANDAGELSVVWATSEALTIVGLTATADGKVYISASNRTIALTPTGDTFNGFSGTPFTPGAGYDVFYASSNTPGGTPPSPGSIRQPISIPRYCQANCDSSTVAPVLNVADFTCFLNRYAAGDLYANCDGSSAEPTLNVADFTCFLQAFAGGCE
jgi:hypothetical protein